MPCRYDERSGPATPTMDEESERWVPLEFERYIALLDLIPREPKWKTTMQLEDELRRTGYGANRRTVQRILEYFHDQFGVRRRPEKRTERKAGSPYEWAWPRRGGRFPIPVIDPPTVLTYELAAELLAPLLPPAFLNELEWDIKRVRNALAHAGKRTSRLPSKLRIVPRGIARMPAKIHPSVLSAVLEALLSDKRLSVRYAPRFDGRCDVKRYVISPLGLVFRFDTLYLVLVVDEPQDAKRSRDLVREWPLHRFRSAKVTDVPARRPNGFALDTHLESAGFLQNLREPELRALGPTLRLEALFDPQSAVYLEERPFAADQTMHTQTDGRVLLTATVANTRELLSELQAFGADVQVLRPKELRTYFITQSARLQQLYSTIPSQQDRERKRPMLRASPKLVSVDRVT